MYGLHFREELDEPIQRELDALISKLKAFLLREHNEDGTHRFPDFEEGVTSIENTVNEILDRYQAKGQFWKYGPWRMNAARDPRAGRAWLRVPDPAAGTYHNYSPIGIDTAVVLEIEPQGDITITGLKPLEGLEDNRILIIRNRDSGATITLPHESTSSYEPYRFDVNNNQDIILGPKESAWFLYDVGRERWSVVITSMTQGPIGNNTRDGAIEVYIDGNGSTITTGPKILYTRVPYNFTVTGWEIVADQSGSIVIDVWKDSYANFPPTVADTVIGGGGTKPTLSSAQKAQFANLTNWTTSWTKGERLEFNVDSASTVTKVILTIYGTRST